MITRILTTYFLLIFCVFCNSEPVFSTNTSAEWRLPTNIIPLHYNLNIKTYLSGFGWKGDQGLSTFEGQVEIIADVIETTNQIVLNSDSLAIIQVLATTSNNETILSWKLFENLQFLTIRFSENLEPQKGIKILVKFKSRLRTDTKGFYLTPSTKSNGEHVNNAVTQFETTYARSVFPCFDEPGFKATWNVTLEHPTGSHALSNGIELNETVLSDEWTRTEFETTVKMSSYLLAFFIGDFKHKETTTDSGVKIRLYSESKNVDLLVEPLEMAKNSLELFEKLFQIPYPMKKLDFVFLEELMTDGMENYGLVTVKEKYLHKDFFAMRNIIEHEVAHQWFGNLVTMNFWDNIWLSEGMCQYMTRYVQNASVDVDEIETISQSVVFYGDDNIPLNGYTRDDDGSFKVTQIAYGKGSAFIRMISKILGKEQFDKAIRYYLSVNQYQNVDDEDLLDAFSRFVPNGTTGPNGESFNIRSFSKCWTNQNGYPSVLVEKSGENKVTLTQNLGNRLEKGYENLNECGYKWDIPIWYQQAGKDTIELVWMGKDQEQIELETQLPVIINANSDGYYRVFYSDELYEQIGDYLNENQKIVSSSTKLRLLFDAGVSVSSGKTNRSSVSKLTELFLKDPSFLVKSVAENVKGTLTTNVKRSIIHNFQKELSAANFFNALFSNCSVESTYQECVNNVGLNILYGGCANLLGEENIKEKLQLLESWRNRETDEIIKQYLTAILECASSFEDVEPIETTEEEAQLSTRDNWRLPTHIVPVHYDIHLKTYLPGFSWKADARNLTFEGEVVITVDVFEPTDRIVLHSEVEVFEVEIVTKEGHIKIVSYETTPELQFLTLKLSETISPQEGVALSLKFWGKLRDDLKGYYLTNVYTETGEMTLSAVTQFETTSARYMIPCFDEPEFKATWQMRLEYPNGAIGLTNGIELSSEILDEWTITTYQKTVRMSSYLLAVYVGNLNYKETFTNRGVRIRVYAAPHQLNLTDHALNVSRLTVEGFEKQFGIDYPMEKIDFVPIDKLSFVAMENWGLIVHAEHSLLGEPGYVADVVIHELAHQWFGNLVTMKFWEDVYLNEGFATYMEMYGHTYLTPGFDRDFKMTTKYQNLALERKEPAIKTMVKKDDGDIVIPYVNYSKGSSFLRMIEHIIGTANFNLAVQKYLNDNKYKNVDDSALFDAFDEFIPHGTLGPLGKPLDLKEFAFCWTHQNGHPTVHVRKTHKGTIYVTQTMDVKTEEKYDKCGYKWDIPIWYQTSESDYVYLTWLGKDQERLELPIDSDETFVVNANSNGIYRVKYENSELKKISDALKNNSQVFTDTTKFRLLKDTKHYLSETEADVVLSLIEALITDDNELIAENSKYCLKHLRNMLQKKMNDLGEISEKVESLILKQINEGSVFSKCTFNESFVDCFKKMKIPTEKLPQKIRSELNQERIIRLIIHWIQVEEIAVFRDVFIGTLKCTDETIRERILDEYPELRDTVINSQQPEDDSFCDPSNNFFSFSPNKKHSFFRFPLHV